MVAPRLAEICTAGCGRNTLGAAYSSPSASTIATSAYFQRGKSLIRKLSHSCVSGLKSVTSEGRLRVGGAQEPECTRQYMRIPRTAGAQDAERSSFASRSRRFQSAFGQHLRDRAFLHAD